VEKCLPKCSILASTVSGSHHPGSSLSPNPEGSQPGGGVPGDTRQCLESLPVVTTWQG
jgi:hypothetical protein